MCAESGGGAAKRCVSPASFPCLYSCVNCLCLAFWFIAWFRAGSKRGRPAKAPPQSWGTGKRRRTPRSREPGLARSTRFARYKGIKDDMLSLSSPHRVEAATYLVPVLISFFCGGVFANSKHIMGASLFAATKLIVDSVRQSQRRDRSEDTERIS